MAWFTVKSLLGMGKSNWMMVKSDWIPRIFDGYTLVIQHSYGSYGEWVLYITSNPFIIMCRWFSMTYLLQIWEIGGMFPGYVGLPAAELNDAFNLVAQRSDLGDDDSDGDYMGSIWDDRKSDRSWEGTKIMVCDVYDLWWFWYEVLGSWVDLTTWFLVDPLTSHKEFASFWTSFQHRRLQKGWSRITAKQFSYCGWLRNPAPVGGLSHYL